MKKILAIVLTMCCVLSFTVLAYADFNAKQYSDEELVNIYKAIKEELKSRGVTGYDSRELTAGKYIVGEDIEPGTYVFTCTGMTGEDLNDAYSSMGQAYGAILGDASLGDLFGSLGNAMETLSTMKIEILGDYGTVLKTVELKPEQSVELTLSEKTAVQLTDGTCSISLKN